MSDRLLFLERYLMENTDEDTTVTTMDILEAYEERGFRANRNTIPNDIRKLQEAGIRVECKRDVSTKCYYIAERLLSVAELRTLIDAISSSQFITKEKSDELIGRLASIAIEKKRDSLTAKAFTADRIKTDAPDIFETIDKIGRSIEEKKKIAFQYIDYLPDKTLILRHDKKEYKVSPLVMIWNDDRYYARCIDPEKEPNKVNYRIDRMRNVQIQEEKAETDPSFNRSDYANKVHLMFDDGLEAENVVLIAENRRMINIIDKFGEKTETSILDDGHFQATVSVIPSATFFSWVFQYQDSIRIAGPEHVKKEYEALLKKTIEGQEQVVTKN